MANHFEIEFRADRAATDEEIAQKHGDNRVYSIARWRDEANAGETTLPYIDWRCDKLWCAAQRRKGNLL